MNLDIRKVPLEQVNPAPYNPRKELQPGEPEYEKLKRSLEAFGCVEPLVWNQRTGNLVGGHQRFNVLCNEGLITDGLVTVSVIDLDPDQEMALNVALNKITGVWDEEKLAALLEELQESEIDVTLTGFNAQEAEDLINDFRPIVEDEEAFSNREIDPADYAEDKFSCQCPKCGFVFNPKEDVQYEPEEEAEPDE